MRDRGNNDRIDIYNMLNIQVKRASYQVIMTYIRNQLIWYKKNIKKNGKTLFSICLEIRIVNTDVFYQIKQIKVLLM